MDRIFSMELFRQGNAARARQMQFHQQKNHGFSAQASFLKAFRAYLCTKIKSGKSRKK
jgi:hypothetical protein